MLALTLWPISRYELALPALDRIRPGAVQLHADPYTLDKRGVQIADKLRALHPGVQIWVGLTGDIWATDTARLIAKGRSKDALDTLSRKRMVGIHAAKAMGAARVVFDPEGRWEHRAPGFDAAAATAFVASAKQELGAISLYVTSFDIPGEHGAFPYQAFDAADGWVPQIYAAPKTGVAGLNAARGRLEWHKAQWARATQQGTVRKRPVSAYVQGHHVLCEGTCAIADAHDDVCIWAAPDLIDMEGLRAAQALAEIERRGFTGVGRIGRFQASAGLKSDGIVGPQTLAALQIR